MRVCWYVGTDQTWWLIFWLVDIIVHTATSIVSDILSNLIDALGQRRKISGKETYFLHASPPDT
jgi:hypothetical protein